MRSWTTNKIIIILVNKDIKLTTVTNNKNEKINVNSSSAIIIMINANIVACSAGWCISG